MGDWCGLAFETATEQASVAVTANGQTHMRVMSQGRNSSREVYTVTQALLLEAGISLTDLQCVACSHGPGSFTGVRVAVAVTQALGYSLAVPVVGVSTLAALARVAMLQGLSGLIAPCLDARMGEAYVGAYQCAVGLLPAELAPDRLVAPAAYAAARQADRMVAVGSGWQAHGIMLQAGPQLAQDGVNLWPTASAVLELAAARYRVGQQTSPAMLRPNYLRDKVADKSAG